jgi:uncharacterized membrane protein
MIRLEQIYDLAGVMFAAVAVLSAGDRQNAKRWRNALFWGLMAVSFLAGSFISNLANGVLALGLAAVAGFGGLGQGGGGATTSAEEREASAAKRGAWLALPALIIPATALIGSLLLPQLQTGSSPLLDPTSKTLPALLSLALGVGLALAVALPWLRASPLAPVQETRRVLDSVGWAAILPQMLAALGAVFALSGVGDAVSRLAESVIPVNDPLAVVVAYTCGMALLTMVMGNAFAAFPVMTAGIGVPLIVKKFGGDPAVLGAVGMLSGFCGTLCTPMAANFNLVPPALLQLKDRYAVIKAQLPTAALLLAANTVLMYLLVFHHRPS